MIISSKISISNSIFINNQAVKGASLGIICTFLSQCDVSLKNITFNNNTASSMGGGIYYNLNRPSLTDCGFMNNSALHGPDIASYAVKIVKSGTQENKITLNDVASSLLYQNTLSFDLIDFDRQIMNLENSHTVKIFPKLPTSSVKGTDFSKFQEGIVKFDNLIFINKAGAQEVAFE